MLPFANLSFFTVYTNFFTKIQFVPHKDSVLEGSTLFPELLHAL